MTPPAVVWCRISTRPRNVGSMRSPTLTPPPAAVTGWMPVAMSAPVCSQTAPDGHARSAVPLQYRHWLPNPRQCGDQVGSGYWKTSAADTAASRGAAAGDAGAGSVGLGPGGCTATHKTLKTQRTPERKPGSAYRRVGLRRDQPFVVDGAAVDPDIRRRRRPADP